MKWYRLTWTRTLESKRPCIHVPDLLDWLSKMQMHDRKLADFWRVTSEWWVKSKRGHGEAPLQIELLKSSVGDVLRLLNCKRSEVHVRLVPEHEMPSIAVVDPMESGVARLEFMDDGEARELKSVAEFESLEAARDGLQKHYDKWARLMEIKNYLSTRRDEARLHELYDELREYVRRTHGQEMPPAHRKDSNAGQPQEGAVA